MEDIIPVFIVVVLFAEIPYLRSELNLMLDYIHGVEEDFEPEKRMLVNLSVMPLLCLGILQLCCQGLECLMMARTKGDLDFTYVL